MYACIRLANDFVNVKRKQNSLFVVRKIPTFYLGASQTFTEATNFTEAVASVASYVATTRPVNSVSVSTPAKKTPIGKVIIILFDWNAVFLLLFYPYLYSLGRSLRMILYEQN